MFRLIQASSDSFTDELTIAISIHRAKLVAAILATTVPEDDSMYPSYVLPEDLAFFRDSAYEDTDGKDRPYWYIKEEHIKSL